MILPMLNNQSRRGRPTIILLFLNLGGLLYGESVAARMRKIDQNIIVRLNTSPPHPPVT
jgi:hypothetical protein